MRIGITQRVEVVPGYGERRDCLDQAWARLFAELGWDLLPIPNRHADVAGWARRQALDGLVLSGGNDLALLPNAANPAAERDACETVLLNWAAREKLPVLGVCRGMQMMNAHLGGALAPLKDHVACRHPVRVVTGCPDSLAVLEAYAEVNSFHAWGIVPGGLAAALEPLLLAHDGSIEGFFHHTLPWVGIMWHPERDNGQSSALDQVLLKAIFSRGGQEEQ